MDTALLVGIPSVLLSSVIEGRGFDPSQIVLKNRFQVRDAQLESIGWLMKRELEAGNPCGTIYGWPFPLRSRPSEIRLTTTYT